MRNFPWRHLLIIVLIAAAGRALLLASGTVSFHSDEAVVALMARHINQGARPVFFYGQVYMGSLDAWLVAIGFRLLGESVASIRLMQSALYLLVVATAYAAAWMLSGRRIVAAVAGLTFALASALVATYTTATLGGYNEVLLLGNLILICGYRVVYNRSDSPRFGSWALLGTAAGLGWWANGLIVMYALPVALLGLVELIRRVRGRASLTPYLGGIVVAGACFFAGSAPWWMYNLNHDFTALKFYVNGNISGGVDNEPVKTSMLDHLLGLLLFGLPTLIGMRFSWLPSYFLAPVGLIVLSIDLLAAYRLARVNPLKPGGRALVFVMIGLFLLIFVVSPFGADPTGRYFLPLVLPLGLLLGTLADSLAHPPAEADVRPKRLIQRVAPVLIVGLVLGYQVVGQLSGAAGEYGLTTQFDLITQIPNDHDAEVIAFLEDHDLTHGYTNYWVAFRLAFLSGETLQYSASLPYKANLTYNQADNRYPPYAEATDDADRIAYITTQLPELDQALEAAWQAQNITYQRADIGDFHIYYDFSSRPAPLSFEAP